MVQSQIEKMRKSLLDLTRRNPLIDTKFGGRTASYVRVVDELPDELFSRLAQGDRLRFDALPDFDAEPADERTETFRTALRTALAEDEVYAAAIDAIDQTAEDAAALELTAERELRDRVRDDLGMPNRGDSAKPRLAEHAEANGIGSSYELPMPGVETSDRHRDDAIQTLLLPDKMERTLDNIRKRYRSMREETGVNVMQVAFGFLAWTDPSADKRATSPLILLPAEIEKTRPKGTSVFHVLGDGAAPAVNTVLAEKLRNDFDVTLPEFDGESVETYLTEVAKLMPKRIAPTVHRFVTFGLFPSAQLAMYRDLAPGNWDFTGNGAVARLLGAVGSAQGSAGVGGLGGFATEHDVDAPATESKVPFLVYDADSSQFSALVDIADGRHLALEGPPGTGKSQTIVNAIVAAIVEGKKVLFVAEKSAALQVVHSRLDQIGLGDFVLPLTAGTTQVQTLDAIRRRTKMRTKSLRTTHAAARDAYLHARERLTRYIDVLTSPVHDSGRTAYDVIGRALLLEEALDGLDIVDVSASDAVRHSALSIQDALRQAHRYAEEHVDDDVIADGWRAATVTSETLDRFDADRLRELSSEAAARYREAAALRVALEGFTAPAEPSIADVERLRAVIAAITEPLSRADRDIIVDLVRDGSADDLAALLGDCAAIRGGRASIMLWSTGLPSMELATALRRLDEVCRSVGFATLDRTSLEEEHVRRKDVIRRGEAAVEAWSALTAAVPDVVNVPLSTVSRAAELVRGTPDAVRRLCGPAFADQSASTIAERAHADLQWLHAETADLGALLDLTAPVDADEVRSDAALFRDAGGFSALSGRFRQARRRWRSRALGNRRFTAAEAAVEFARLAEWDRRRTAFTEDLQFRTLLGAAFAGIDTDASTVYMVIRYLAQVDREFPGLGDRPMRMLLRTGETDVLGTLAMIAAPEFDNPLSDMDVQLKERRADVDAWAQAMSEAADLDGRLASPQSTDPSTLRVLADVVAAHVDDVRRIEAHPLKSVLRSRWRGVDTEQADVEAEAAVVRTIGTDPTWTRFWLTVLGEDGLDAVRDLVAVDPAVAASATAATIAESIGAPTAPGTCAESAERFAAMAIDHSGLTKVVRVNGIARQLERTGFGAELAAAKAAGRQRDLAAIVEARIFRTLARSVLVEHGETLLQVARDGLDAARAEIAELDREWIRASIAEARNRLISWADPPPGVGVGPRSAWTDGALIDNELAKKRRHIPVRQLTARAGRALQELMPCWMMSPLQVAQYVGDRTLSFDLCIIDEASQMTPANAIGALIRSKQAVVVGDTKQLPPTNFFQSVLKENDDDDEEATEELAESVLEMANSAFRPPRRLRWHYRSRHSGLISFSNREMYDDDLIVFPSPEEGRVDMGVSLERVEGRYRKGENPIEAEAVVDAAFAFMRDDPDRSLGIVALNRAQASLIEDMIERRRITDRAADAYIADRENDGLGSFFVKNLESVQGDERDVIFISTVYGPDPDSEKVAQRFGPINGAAGRRRLNVLFSRARHRIVTFSSMTAADIKASFEANPGAYMLKHWLEYSATGVIDVGMATGRDFDSDFEEHVAHRIRALGCEVVPQVGVAGYFIDLAVRHPMWPHGYLLGVECDGATYHSSKSARDRDRLRQEVLERLGWTLHRVWSTNWFDDPDGEVVKLEKAIRATLKKKGVTPPG